jgi:hypothetical protein
MLEGRKTPPCLDVHTCQLDVQGHISEEKDFEFKVFGYLECSYLMDKTIMEQL